MNRESKFPLKGFAGAALWGGMLLISMIAGLMAPRWLASKMESPKPAAESPADTHAPTPVKAESVAELKLRQEEQMNSYQIIDAEAGIAAIPIEAAMEAEASKNQGE